MTPGRVCIEGAVPPSDIGIVALLNVEPLLAFLAALDPVDDRNVHVRFARPGHARHGFGDRAAISDDVIQASFAAVVLANCVGAATALKLPTPNPQTPITTQRLPL